MTMRAWHFSLTKGLEDYFKSGILSFGALAALNLRAQRREPQIHFFNLEFVIRRIGA